MVPARVPEVLGVSSEQGASGAGSEGVVGTSTVPFSSVSVRDMVADVDRPALAVLRGVTVNVYRVVGSSARVAARSVVTPETSAAVAVVRPSAVTGLATTV